LISNINEDGSFSEPGTIIHKDMQGGVHSKLTITSYILISLLESNIFDFLNQKILNSIAKSTKYLEKNFDSVQNDTYSICLMTYALNLGNSKLSDKSFFLLDSLAKKHNDDELYWSAASVLESTEASSSDIEMTSYALLTYLVRGEKNKSLSIVKWLISKSNSLGAYSSTHNTVLALQSLSQFGLSILSPDEGFNYNVDINVIAETSFNQKSSKSFNVNANNSFILQTWDLPSCDFDMNISAFGSGGIAALQAIFKYNLKNKSDQQHFSLKQKIVDTNNSINKILIETCIQYRDLNDNETGMSIFEANLFSGFEVDKADMDYLLISKNTSSELKLIEILKDNKVAFYMQKLNSKNVCFNWTMTRSYLVSF
jgi:CD109 antigen